MPAHRPVVIGGPSLPALLSEAATRLAFLWILFPGLPFSPGFWPETPCGLRPLPLSQRPPHVAWSVGSETRLWVGLYEPPCPCFSLTCKMGRSQPRIPRIAVRTAPGGTRAGPGAEGGVAPHPALRCHLLLHSRARFGLALRSAPSLLSSALPFPGRLVASAYHARFSQAAEVGLLIPFLE